MQVMPQSEYPSNGLYSFKIYDQLNLLVHQYSHPDHNDFDDKRITSFSSSFGTTGVDVSLAYNEQYRMFGKSCFGCNETLNLHHIYVDGNAYT